MSTFYLKSAVCDKFILMKKGRDIWYLLLFMRLLRFGKDALGLVLGLIKLLDMIE